MTRTHTHHPDGKGPVCRFETKRECDAYVREQNAIFKAEQAAAKEAKMQAERLHQQAVADAFIAKEWARMVEAAAEEEPAVDRILDHWSRTRVPDLSGHRDRSGAGASRLRPATLPGLRRVRPPAPAE